MNRVSVQQHGIPQYFFCCCFDRLTCDWSLIKRKFAIIYTYLMLMYILLQSNEVYFVIPDIDNILTLHRVLVQQVTLGCLVPCVTNSSTSIDLQTHNHYSLRRVYVHILKRLMGGHIFLAFNRYTPYKYVCGATRNNVTHKLNLKQIRSKYKLFFYWFLCCICTTVADNIFPTARGNNVSKPKGIWLFEQKFVLKIFFVF